ncbi:hyalin-like [Acanthaster planci]|uniref:Hyalin-like n=1 Tax=Acanthaster planci TaxID=133434 RepID=A0A8B7ZS90_ACAPL|nr:hyalin-like [Acanthaster planci]
MAANGYLVVAAVLLITALMIEPALSQDTVPPQIFNCLMDDLGGMTVSITSQTATATWTAPAAVNFQPGGTPTNPDSQSNVYSQFSGVTPFNYGFTTVRYLFIDNPPGSAQQNSAICSFFVRIGLVTDVVSPTVSNCPSDTTQFISSGQTSASVTWIEPTASDNNGVVRRSWRSHAPGFQFPPGSTEVFYQWIDPTNPNTPVECRFNVILSTLGTDATVPSLTCPNDVVANPTTGVATWIVPIPFDSSGISTTTPSHNPGDVFSEGFTDVTYSTVDNFNNRASCSFTVRRSPSTEQYVPVITSCPENIQQVLPAGSTSGSVTWPAVTAYDDSGHLRLLMQTYSSGASFPLGTTPVEYRYQDAAGKIARCVFTVGLTVQAADTTPPIITCPSSIGLVSRPAPLWCGLRFPISGLNDERPEQAGAKAPRAWIVTIRRTGVLQKLTDTLLD